jgi:hypothetical protein
MCSFAIEMKAVYVCSFRDSNVVNVMSDEMSAIYSDAFETRIDSTSNNDFPFHGGIVSIEGGTCKVSAISLA